MPKNENENKETNNNEEDKELDELIFFDMLDWFIYNNCNGHKLGSTGITG